MDINRYLAKNLGLFCFYSFEIRSHYVVEAVLELSTLFSHLSAGWTGILKKIEIHRFHRE